MRTTSLALARVTIGVLNLLHDMRGMGQLLKREVQAESAGNGHDGSGTSAAA
ncbi:MAG: hypothetical protein ABIH03_02615 [Pseudomonadota bacterium]